MSHITPPQIPHVLRINRTDHTETDGLPFVVVNLTPLSYADNQSATPNLVGTRIVATDGQDVFICEITQFLISHSQAKGYKGTPEEWLSVLAHCFFGTQSSDGVGSKDELGLVEITATVEDSNLRLNIRKQIGGITQRLGLVNIPASIDESAESDADILAWAASACQWSTFHRNRALDLETQLQERIQLTQRLQQDMDDLVARHRETEDILLEKFTRVLNSKKRFIREQLGEQSRAVGNSFRQLQIAPTTEAEGAGGQSEPEPEPEVQPATRGRGRGRGARGARGGAVSTRGGRKAAPSKAVVDDAPPATASTASKRKRTPEPEPSMAGSGEDTDGTDLDSQQEDMATDSLTDEASDHNSSDDDADVPLVAAPPALSRSESPVLPPTRATRTSRRIAHQESTTSTKPAPAPTKQASKPTKRQPPTRANSKAVKKAEPETVATLPLPTSTRVVSNSQSTLSSPGPLDDLARRMDRTDVDMDMDLEPVSLPPPRVLPFMRKGSAKLAKSPTPPPAEGDADDDSTDADEL